MSNEGRLDLPNDIEQNGELMVQRVVLEKSTRSPLHILDIGANVGDWSAHLLAVANQTDRQMTLHAFEPAPATFKALYERIGSAAGVKLVKAAASDRSGEAVLHLIHETAGINSLHGRTDMTEAGTTSVTTTTLDQYCAVEGISHVALAKCDTEGHDFAVLEGARGLLAKQHIDVFQFEYNWRWIDARRFLRDVFALAAEFGYRVGKVTPEGVETYSSWHPELESYREGNYLLLAPTVWNWFPDIRWWNAPG